MASVDNTVRNLILTSPGIVPNRTEALHFLLCVLGNGYGWDEDGTVVSTMICDLPPWTREDHIGSAERRGVDMPDHLFTMFMEIAEQEADKSQAIVDAVDELMHNRAPIANGDFYPQCDGALLMKMPDNVTPDWREACDEMKALARQHGWKF